MNKKPSPESPEDNISAQPSLQKDVALFRPTAVTARTQRLKGDVLIAQPMSMKLTIWLCMGMAFAAVAYASQVNWKTRQTVFGQLMPPGGLVGVFPLQAGVISEVFVELGDHVNKGDPLASVIAPTIETENVELVTEKIAALNREIELIREGIRTQEKLILTTRSDLDSRSTILRQRLKLIQEQIVIQKSRYKKSTEFLELALSGGEFISIAEQRRREIVAMTDNQSLLSLFDQKQVLIEAQGTLDTEVSRRILESQQRIVDLRRNLSQSKRQRITVSLDQGYIIRSPSTGQVTTLNLATGNYMETNQRLLTILPDGQELFAKLFIPSRAAGFVETGQSVQIQYLAFPYERYGFHIGSIGKISQSIVGSANIPDFILERNESFFTAEIKLPQQYFAVKNEKVPLVKSCLMNVHFSLGCLQMF